MDIRRQQLFEAFSTFAQKNNGVVVGPPGVGKTYTLRAFCHQLIDVGQPCLYLPIDKLSVDTEAELYAAVPEFKGDFIGYLRNEISQGGQAKGLLLIDAFDAARSEKARAFYFRLIKQVLSTLDDHWNTIISVRTYDAKRSQELLELFPAPEGITPSQYQLRDIKCRHFAIPRLEHHEVKSIVKDMGGAFAEAYEHSSIDLQELLRTPFNLWLVDKLLSEKRYVTAISKVSSEVELLGMFWQQRVIDSPIVEELRYLLNSATSAMVNSRSLSVRREEVYVPGANKAWNELLSVEILGLPSEASHYVSFKHNILFDYAVAVLLIDENPIKFSEFILEDPSRPFFLRPSLNYFFAYLWYRSPSKFWNLFWHVLPKDSSPQLRLFSRLLPPSTVVVEAKNIDELNPLIEALSIKKAEAPNAIKYVLQAYRTLDVTRDELWLQFLEKVSPYLSEVFIVELTIAFSEILERVISVHNEKLRYRCGEMARRLLIWVWHHRSTSKSMWVDSFGSQRVVSLVTRTFDTDPAESAMLLKKILELIGEDNFPIRYLYKLTQDLEYIWPYSPEFAANVYLTVFGHRETSEAPIPLGGIVLSMTTTRRQEYESCRYNLRQHFSKFLRSSSTWATRAIVTSLNLEIIHDHVFRDRTDLKPISTISELKEELVRIGKSTSFEINQTTAWYTPDYSFVWDQGERFQTSLEMADQLFAYLEDLASKNEEKELSELLKLLIETVLVAFFWRKLLSIAAKNPSAFTKYLFEFCIAYPILVGNEVLYPLGQFIEAAAYNFSDQQIGKIERAIVELPSRGQDTKLKEALELKRDRLLSRIPMERLQTGEGKLLRELLAAAPDQQYKANEPLVTVSGWTKREYTEEIWFQEQGVDITQPRNKYLREYTIPLKEFADEWHNKRPSHSAVQSILHVSQKLFEILTSQEFQADSEIVDSAWTHLAAALETVCRSVTDLSREEFKFTRDVLLACSAHYLPEANPDFDKHYDFPTWSASPRIAAAQGLPILSAHDSDREIKQAIARLASDPVPSVRFLTALNLWRINQTAPRLHWQLADQIAKDEQNRVVLQGLCNSLSRLVDSDKTKDIIDVLLERSERQRLDSEVIEYIVKIIAWLFFNKREAWAAKKIEAIQQEPVKYSTEMDRLVFSALSTLNPKRLALGDQTTQYALGWLPVAVDAVATGIEETILKSDLDRGSESEDVHSAKLQELYRIIDSIVSQLYFAQMRHENNTDAERHNYYWEMKPLLQKILNYARTPKSGIMLAPTAHHFMEFLNDAVRYDPDGVLTLSSELALVSAPYNYQLDPLAVREVVKLVETVLADYRDIVQEGVALESLLSLLDVFVDAGWPDALQLVWRLDEVFR